MSFSAADVMLALPLPGGWAEALDFDPDAAGIGYDVGLLDAHPGGRHTLIGQARLGDALGQGFDQMNMTLRHDRFDTPHDGLVAHNILNVVGQVR